MAATVAAGGRDWRARSLAGLALLAALVLGACASPGGTNAAGYRAYAIGDPAAPTPGQVQPGVLLLGGGEWPLEAMRWFFGRAGNGHLLILRASYGPENQEEMYNRIGGLASVRTFVLEHRRAGHAQEILDAVAAADGIYFGGGDQARYVRFIQGTSLQQALNRHVAQGKPIGGTSAGLAILGRYAYGALDGNSLAPQTALADADSPQITLVEGFLVVEPLHSAGVLTDTHFAERHRQGRLMAMLDQLQRRHPGQPLLGLGIDEDTALALTPVEARLYTDNDGRAWLFHPRPPVPRTGSALETSAWPVDVLGPDSRLRFPGWSVEAPVLRTTAQVRQGRLSYAPPLPWPEPEQEYEP